MKGGTIKKEIEQLEKQLQEKKAALEQSGNLEKMPSDKEVLRQVIGEKIQQNAPSYTPAPSSPAPDPNNTPSYLTEELRAKVQELVNYVFQNSLSDGIKIAVKSENPALLDAFHDILVDELYDQLVERKKIEQVI